MVKADHITSEYRPWRITTYIVAIENILGGKNTLIENYFKFVPTAYVQATVHMYFVRDVRIHT